jgi:anaerobic selenocysteine-containing dehydrogenase
MPERLYSVCPHACPSQCALAGAGDPAHPFTRGVICGKVHDYAERLYAPTRVLTPLRRVGAKGEGRFEPRAWDAAAELIASRWNSSFNMIEVTPLDGTGTAGPRGA